MVEKKKTGRRGNPRYLENPFVDRSVLPIKTRKLTNSDGNMMIVSRDTGEIVSPTGFWKQETVDAGRFVKLYVAGVKAFKGLTGAGTQVFEILYMEMQNNPGKDAIFLFYGDLDLEKYPIHQRTFIRGIGELINKGFLAEGAVSGKYFVNPDYIWNGDRLAFIKEYRLARQEKEEGHRQGAIPFSDRAECDAQLPPAEAERD